MDALVFSRLPGVTRTAYSSTSPSLAAKIMAFGKSRGTKTMAGVMALGWGLVLAMSVSAVSLAQEETRKPPDRVFLLIGQSNMSGRAELTAEDRQEIDGVLLFNAAGTWEPARAPLNRYSNLPDNKAPKLGPGDYFVRAVRKSDANRTVGLIVNARGGTSIEQWAKGQPLYNKTLQRVRQAGVRFEAVLWHQGENNSQDRDYLSKLEKLIGDLREDLKQPGLPFIAGEIHGKAPVNEQLAQLPGKVAHTAVASAEGLKKTDAFHFDRASQITLGERYAEALQRLSSASDGKADAKVK